MTGSTIWSSSSPRSTAVSPISRGGNGGWEKEPKTTELGSSGAKTATRAICLATSAISHKDPRNPNPSLSLPGYFYKIVLTRCKWERKRPKNPPVIPLTQGGGDITQNPKYPLLFDVTPLNQENNLAINIHLQRKSCNKKYKQNNKQNLLTASSASF